MSSTTHRKEDHANDSCDPHCADALVAAVGDVSRPANLSVTTVMRFVGIETIAEFARRAGVSRRTAYRWLQGGLDVWTADHLAVKVAHNHPATVFGTGWFDADRAKEAA